MKDPAPTRGLRRHRLERPFVLESGESLAPLEIAYRTWGSLNARSDNAIVVCHALTASAAADQWWAPLFGAGRALDPAEHFIVCSSALGSCYGTTGPDSPGPDGARWGARFPRITLRDQVRAQVALADALGVRGIVAVLGGSMGGQQALEWALIDGERVRSVACIAASGRQSAWCLAWNEAQRLAIAAAGDEAAAGLAAARAIAMISYRSSVSLGRRFGRARAPEPQAGYAAAGWLRRHGDRLVDRFDADSYRCLLDAMDSHDVGRGRGAYEDVLREIHQPVLIGSIASDVLYPLAEQLELLRLLPRAQLLQIDSLHGHDGFLIDAQRFEAELRRFIRVNGRRSDERVPPPDRPAASRARLGPATV